MQPSTPEVIWRRTELEPRCRKLTDVSSIVGTSPVGVMMRKLSLCPAVLAIIAVGCGGSPTAPAAAQSERVTAISTPAPAPAPAPSPSPAPSPDPAPAPAPGPAPVPPAPTPAPADAGTRYTAHVDTIHWYGEPLFTSPTFELTRYADRITFGSVTLPIVSQDARGLVARTSEMTFTVVDAAWTFNGLAGTGSGTLSK
jgi:hypothetical protein